MYSIIPIAGPEYTYGVSSKALMPTLKGPFLKHILESRPWSALLKNNEYIFALRDSESSRDFFTKFLQDWLPDCKAVFLSNTTNGAAFTVASVISQLSLDPSSPIIVDLADIYLETKALDYIKLFKGYDYLALTFQSHSSLYSYFKVDSDGGIVEAREKLVISSNASAGVYIFARLSLFYESLSYAIENKENCFYNNLCYMAPLLNSAFHYHRSSCLIPCSLVLDPKPGELLS